MFDRIKSWLPLNQPAARILLAEDDAEMRDLLATMLRRDGHEVLAFPDGHHALAYIETLLMVEGAEAPDLIISDVRMPGPTGLEILAALREANVEVPVILITAFGDRAAHQEAFDLGAAMIDKPFAIDTLRTTVRCLVR